MPLLPIRNSSEHRRDKRRVELQQTGLTSEYAFNLGWDECKILLDLLNTSASGYEASPDAFHEDGCWLPSISDRDKAMERTQQTGVVSEHAFNLGWCECVIWWKAVVVVPEYSGISADSGIWFYTGYRGDPTVP